MIASIHAFDMATARNLEGVFFDIDDTFTTRGKIPASAFQAVWALKGAGLKVVPITGRPAGWVIRANQVYARLTIINEDFGHLVSEAEEVR